MLKLFFGGCAVVSRMALEEARVPYELIVVSLEKSEQRKPEYLAINPKGRVPALATPHGILTENPAILLYVALTHPEARLAPLQDPWRLARMNAFNGFIASTIHVEFSKTGRPERYLNTEEAKAELRMRALAALRGHFELIDKELAAGPWMLGGDFSTADIYLSFFSQLATRFDWFASCRNVAAHLDRMKQRPSFDASYAVSGS